MKRLLLNLFVILVATGLIASQASAGEVVQGKCIQFDKEQHKVIIEEYDINFCKESPYGKSTGIVFEGDIKNAKIGLSPQPGDILRVAYKLDGNSKRVLKIMNITKQDLKQK